MTTDNNAWGEAHRKRILANEFGTREKFQNLNADIACRMLADIRDDIRQNLGDIDPANLDSLPAQEDLRLACYAINRAIAHVTNAFPMHTTWADFKDEIGWGTRD